ncbi:TetR family transcriptional regulator [Aeromicrobium sp. Sec7.5]|uniref:TetR family transcriptional regulator n=1 Tax=Aeromicrobium sp. Sec7.5 TaxID=3121276 RepID=UPI002FE43FB9
MAAGDTVEEPTSGAVLRAARTARGLSLRAVAEQTKVSPAALSQFETGKSSLAAERLAQVAAFLGVEIALPAAAPHTEVPAFQHWRAFDPPAFDPVLRAALEVFVEKGYHGASIREIAEQAHLSVAGIYHHHPSKQALLVALMESGMHELLDRSEAARAEGHDPLDRVCLLVEAIVLCQLHRQQQAFLGASELRSLTPPNLARQVALRDRQQAMVEGELVAAVEAGQVEVARPDAAARALVTMCTAVASWYRPGGGMDPDEVAAQYVEYALRLLGPPLTR